MSKRKKRLDESLVDLYFGQDSGSMSSRGSQRRRKDAQLCSQVADALSLALADSEDPAMVGLWVTAVEPAPHVGQLRVCVEAGPGTDPWRLQAKLEARTPHLRRQVGAAIHRKKVPSLRFVVLPRGGVEVR